MSSTWKCKGSKLQWKFPLITALRENLWCFCENLIIKLSIHRKHSIACCLLNLKLSCFRRCNLVSRVASVNGVRRHKIASLRFYRFSSHPRLATIDEKSIRKVAADNLITSLISWLIFNRKTKSSKRQQKAQLYHAICWQVSSISRYCFHWKNYSKTFLTTSRLESRGWEMLKTFFASKSLISIIFLTQHFWTLSRLSKCQATTARKLNEKTADDEREERKRVKAYSSRISNQYSLVNMHTMFPSQRVTQTQNCFVLYKLFIHKIKHFQSLS